MKHPLTHALPLPRGLVARVAIQCTHPESGLTGSWLYSGETHREPGTACTPLFDDCAALFLWAKANGWEQIGVGLDAAYTLQALPHVETLAVFET